MMTSVDVELDVVALEYIDKNLFASKVDVLYGRTFILIRVKRHLSHTLHFTETR